MLKPVIIILVIILPARVSIIIDQTIIHGLSMTFTNTYIECRSRQLSL